MKPSDIVADLLSDIERQRIIERYESLKESAGNCDYMELCKNWWYEFSYIVNTACNKLQDAGISRSEAENMVKLAYNARKDELLKEG